MSTDISKVYLFLAQQGGIEAADKNGDGYVIKSEFREFMEDNFAWDGETTDAGKNDLINTFWKSIDTNQGGKISGTRLKNKNALDKNEVEKMNKKVEMYEILNDFTSTISAPGVVSDAANWKKSVSEGLAALIEPYIASGKSKDDLLAYLEEQAPKIEAKATADYCANEYLNSEMADFVKEYGYSYAEDATLQGILNTYIQNIPPETDFETIKDTVINIIDAYLATAGLKEENACDLADYGYKADENSPLNGLQQSIARKNIEKNLEAIKNETDYEAFQTQYDAAIQEYINKVLSEAKFGNFEAIKLYGMTEFKDSDTFKKVQKTVDVNKFFQGDDLKAALTSAISESFANRLTNIMAGELPAYDSILNEAITKAQNGDFDSDGQLDVNKLKEWVVQQFKANLVDFYPNGLGNMPLEDLNTMYDALVASAKEKQDASKIKEAAISYCKAVSAKGNALAQAVKDIFGDNYATAINAMLSGEIQDKMAELKDKVLEIGDVSTFGVDSWSGIEDKIQMDGGKSASYAIGTSIKKPDGTLIDNSRITYTVSGSIATINNGTITINAPSQAGYYTVKIQAMVDGVAVGEAKTIQITVKQSAADTVAAVKDWDGQVSEHLETYNINDGKQVTNSSFADLYNNDAIIRLDCTELKKDRSEWNNGRKGEVVSRLTQLGNLIVSALSTAGLDKSKLQQAMETVKNKYVNQGPKQYSKRRGDITNNTKNTMNSERNTYGHTIVAGYDRDGNTEASYMIRFKDFVDDILAEYWKLVG